MLIDGGGGDPPTPVVQDLLGHFELDSSDEVIPNHCSTISVHSEI